MTGTLKLCPHCGGEAEMCGGSEQWHPTYNDPDSGGVPYRISCKTCDCGTALFLEKEEVIVAWNTRSYSCATKCGCIRQSQPDKKLIYLAMPYGGLSINYMKAQQIMMALQECRRENAYISPIISYGYVYNVYSYEDGMQMCLALLSKCDELYIINDDGKSRGVKIERRFAQDNGIPIHEFATQLDAIEGREINDTNT